MRASTDIKRIAASIYNQGKESVDGIAKLRSSKVEAMKSMGVDEALTVGSELMSQVEAVIGNATEDGVFLPKYLSRLVAREGADDRLVVTIRSKLNAAYKYRKDTEVMLDDDFVLNMGAAYLDSLFEMFYIELAMENVDELNGILANITKENEIPYSIKFVIDHTADSPIASITDDEVVFNAGISEALELSTLGLLQSGDDYNDLVRTNATNELVAVLKAAQTTPQLIKSKVKIISSLLDLPTRKKASKIIRETYHRQARYLDKVKKGVGYYLDKAEVNGETIEVFALVEKAESGEMTVVLKPFDTKTLYNVDIDVLEAVKNQAEA